jgi:hypothetical protein
VYEITEAGRVERDSVPVVPLHAPACSSALGVVRSDALAMQREEVFTMPIGWGLFLERWIEGFRAYVVRCNFPDATFCFDHYSFDSIATTVVTK